MMQSQHEGNSKYAGFGSENAPSDDMVAFCAAKHIDNVPGGSNNNFESSSFPANGGGSAAATKSPVGVTQE
eukprot:5749199-Ditylum_brightwellii.AAC.1